MKGRSFVGAAAEPLRPGRHRRERSAGDCAPDRSECANVCTEAFTKHDNLNIAYVRQSVSHIPPKDINI